MVEKLASTEIAQSRERELQSVCEAIESDWPMRGWQITDLIRPLIRAAERDTRERIAQQARSLLEIVLDVTLNDLSQKNEILDTFERRIRGKV